MRRRHIVLVLAAAALAWFINWPMLVLLALWPFLVLGSAIHDLQAGRLEPLVLVNLIASIVVIAAYWFVPRLLVRRFWRTAPRHL